MDYKKKIVKNYMDADRLMRNGFRCLGMDMNKDGSGRLIFWFANTDKLNDELRKYIEERKK